MVVTRNVVKFDRSADGWRLNARDVWYIHIYVYVRMNFVRAIDTNSDVVLKP